VNRANSALRDALVPGFTRRRDAALIERYRAARFAFGTPLGDEIARLLAAELDGMPCDAIAARLGRRRTDVRLALVSDPRFRRRGRGRASRWLANAAAEASGTGKDGELGGVAATPSPNPKSAETRS